MTQEVPSNGLLARDLWDAGHDVTAIDLDADVLFDARTANADTGIHWLHGDVMGHDLGRQFDVVAPVAMAQHLPDLSATLARLAELTAPGGTLVVVGLAKPTRLRDHVLGLAGVAQHR